MKLKATTKYKLLPHTTKCPFSRNGIRRCFKHKYDFVTSRSTRYFRINRTAQRKISRRAVFRVRLVNPTPLIVWSPSWDEQDQRFNGWNHQNCKVLYKTELWLHAPDQLPVSYKLYLSSLSSFLHSLQVTEPFKSLGTNDNIQSISDTIKSRYSN